MSASNRKGYLQGGITLKSPHLCATFEIPLGGDHRSFDIPCVRNQVKVFLDLVEKALGEAEVPEPVKVKEPEPEPLPSHPVTVGASHARDGGEADLRRRGPGQEEPRHHPPLWGLG